MLGVCTASMFTIEQIGTSRQKAEKRGLIFVIFYSLVKSSPKEMPVQFVFSCHSCGPR